MINPHQFQQAAKQFRSGRISLKEFTDLVITGEQIRKPNEQPAVKKAPKHLVNKPELPKRPVESHKGDFGRVVAIGGSASMAGAISLTGLASLRSGSGLVKVLVPEMIQSSVASYNPSLMVEGIAAEQAHFHGSAKDALIEHANWADVVALGPGMGSSESLEWIIQGLYPDVHQPMVVDADGLNVLVDAGVDLANHKGMRILTPHPGEFKRLCGKTITNREKMEAEAKTMAAKAKIVIVLKGNKTYVTDGEQEFRNDTGNPGMATAGAGDVLTGIITSLVGQGLSPFDAAVFGVNTHGVAGDFASESVGETSLIATDLIEFLPAAFKSQANKSAQRIGF
ncbi:MAG: NAD(P)H-hydrate dehydratase [Mariniblastus sp.]